MSRAGIPGEAFGRFWFLLDGLLPSLIYRDLFDGGLSIWLGKRHPSSSISSSSIITCLAEWADLVGFPDEGFEIVWGKTLTSSGVQGRSVKMPTWCNLLPFYMFTFLRTSFRDSLEKIIKKDGTTPTRNKLVNSQETYCIPYRVADRNATENNLYWRDDESPPLHRILRMRLWNINQDHRIRPRMFPHKI